MTLHPQEIPSTATQSVPHGDDLFRYPGMVKANFSSNVWPGGMLPQLRQCLSGHIDSLGSYPPPHGEMVTARLALHLGVATGCLLLTNGTAEAIYLIARLFAGQVSRIVMPTFSEYEHACALFGHQVEPWHDTEHFDGCHFRHGLFWVCNPNNPTGRIVSREAILSMVADNPSCCFVVDEAYQGLAQEVPSLVNDVEIFPNLLVLRSLTKTYAVPGLRVGYVAGHPDLIGRLAAFQPPWSVNALALHMVDFAVQHRPFTPDELSDYLRRSRHLQTAIGQIAGCEVTASPTGYFIVRTPVLAAQLKEQLVQRFGLLVRDASSFNGLSAYDIRIAVQEDESNRLLLDALRQLLAGE